jgi:hypothetical protein
MSDNIAVFFQNGSTPFPTSSEMARVPAHVVELAKGWEFCPFSPLKPPGNEELFFLKKVPYFIHACQYVKIDVSHAPPGILSATYVKTNLATVPTPPAFPSSPPRRRVPW